MWNVAFPPLDGCSPVPSAEPRDEFMIRNVRVTLAAALQFASPPCDATIVHEPRPVRCTTEGDVGEDNVHWPLAANATGSREVANASISKSGEPNVLSEIAPNVIDCDSLPIATDLVTSGAAKYFPSPACDAVIEHEPAPVMCTIEPIREHV